MIPRLLEDRIKDRLHRKKAIVVLGPRQVGKTTLMEKLFPPSDRKVRWFSGDESHVRESLSQTASQFLRSQIGAAETVVIDEAQRIPNIGLVIKLLVDTNPQVQFVVTGSSALELAAGINESMTGRKFEFRLYPLSYMEMSAQTSPMEEHSLLPRRMVYGYYPDVVTHAGEETELLVELANDYLYKDLLAYQQIKKPAMLEKLLIALAHQVGSEVSYLELAQLIGLDKETVEHYIDLLEKAFVVFRLPALSRNKRNEIKRGRKVYFHDLGIRNTIIRNFNPLGLRADTGALWENFCIVERMKALEYRGLSVNRYFWRTHTQQEIDYVEEYAGKLHAVEWKWNDRKGRAKVPASFLEAYPGSQTRVVTPGNIAEFLLPEAGSKF